jgi:hypothetical protein
MGDKFVILVENLRERQCLENLRVDGDIIKIDFNNWDVRVLNRFNWLTIGCK